jgi:hypothetical protein
MSAWTPRSSFTSAGGWSTATATRRESCASPPATSLAGRATEQEFEVADDGSVVSDRGFSKAVVRREDAEHFIEQVRGDDPELASYLRIDERELKAGGRN